MAFATGYLGDPNKVQGGEKLGAANIILSASTFEDGLVVGRFAKLDTGSIDKIDGSATPSIAGVVLRNPANPVEDDGTIDSSLYGTIEYLRQGLVIVDVLEDETPAQFGTVYVSNQGDANDGLATATVVTGDVTSGGEFIEEIDTDVWLIRLY